MKKCTFIPQGCYIAAKLDAPEKTSKGGIILTESAQDRVDTAIVVSVGEGFRSLMTDQLIPMNVKPGDRVIVGKYAYQPIKLPTGEELVYFAYNDVIGTIREEEIEDGAE